MGGKNLCFFCGDLCIPFHDGCEDSTDGFNAHRQGCLVQEKNSIVCVVSTNDGGLHTGTECNRLVGVDALGQLLSVKEFREELLNPRNAS
mmetsp:Transcript_11603/g.29363  ORF Transcript_11603/g.29363 Transcript_11603/m.29363 type:complete len:90 (-) Transcript_11603:967-1236(-)